MRDSSRFRARASAGVEALQQQLSRRTPTDTGDGGPGRPPRPRTTSRYRENSPERDDDDEPAPASVAGSIASLPSERSPFLPPAPSERSPLLPPAPSADALQRGMGFAADARDAKRPRPSAKMGTFSGVFVPVSLNIVGIILFLRFGFLIGQVRLGKERYDRLTSQAGLLGTVLLLAVAYLVRLRHRSALIRQIVRCTT